MLPSLVSHMSVQTPLKVAKTEDLSANLMLTSHSVLKCTLLPCIAKCDVKPISSINRSGLMTLAGLSFAKATQALNYLKFPCLFLFPFDLFPPSRRYKVASSLKFSHLLGLRGLRNTVPYGVYPFYKPSRPSWRLWHNWEILHRSSTVSFPPEPELRHLPATLSLRSVY